MDDEGSPGYQTGCTAPPLPVAYAATNNSLLHLETAGGATRRQHKHAKGARKLASPMKTSDKYEAFAWLKVSKRAVLVASAWQVLSGKLRE